MTTDSTLSQFVFEESKSRTAPFLYAASAAMVTGGLLAISFPPYDFSWCAWFAIVPLLVVVCRMEVKHAWVLGILAGLVFYRVGLSWAFSLSGPHAGAAILVLSVWFGFSFRMMRLLVDRFGLRAILWAAPLCYAGQEIIRAEGLARLRFGYLALGYSQVDFGFVSQVASVVGVYGLTLLIVGVNAGIAMAILGKRRLDWFGIVPAVLLLGVLVVLSRFSMPVGEPVAVACVQCESADADRHVASAAVAASDQAQPKIIVLPEHAVESSRALMWLAEIADSHDAYICVGTHRDTQTDGACDYDNIARLIGPDGSVVGEQAKSVPVPFFDDGNPATGQEVFRTSMGNVGMCICYDADFSDVPRRLAGMGAEILLIPVMNPESWHTDQREQQAEMARMRSIETRRWCVRAASSGTSQIIDRDGVVLAEREKDDGAGLLIDEARFCGEPSLFVAGGYRVPQGVGWWYLISILLMTISLWRTKEAKTVRDRMTS